MRTASHTQQSGEEELILHISFLYSRVLEAVATRSPQKQFLVYVYYLLLRYKNLFRQALSTEDIFPTKRELQENKVNTTNVFKTICSTTEESPVRKKSVLL